MLYSIEIRLMLEFSTKVGHAPDSAVLALYSDVLEYEREEEEERERTGAPTEPKSPSGLLLN